MILLRQMGIVMNDNEMRALVDAFDANGDGMVTMREFLDFTGPKREKKSGTLLAINQRCCWVTSCKITGMAHAYSYSQVKGEAWIDKTNISESKEDGSGLRRSYFKSPYRTTELQTLKNGEKRLRLESVERQRREQLLKKIGLLKLADDRENEYDDEFEDDDEGKRDPKVRCEYIEWTIKNRKEGLRFLADSTEVVRQEIALKQLLSNGDVPKPPNLWCGKLGESDVGISSDPLILTEEILLRWAPAKDDHVSFFSLEFGGPLSVSGRVDSKYTEIFRDPPDSTTEEFSFCYWVKNLKPCVGYLFRIRAINGYGSGEYTYKTVWTRPMAPLTPKCVSCLSDAVTLRWVFPEGYIRREEDLKAIFLEADIDRSGNVSRQELRKFLEQRMEVNKELRIFLKRVCVALKISPEDMEALFDIIEGDDNNSLSWDEFQTFFMNFGWGDKFRSSLSSNATSLSQSTAATYFVSRCESELTDAYEEILHTTKDSGTIHRLRPGKSYRFRVHAVNPDGVAGAPSPSVVVHTMLETPLSPFETAVETRRIALGWKGRSEFVYSKDKELLTSMLDQWAGRVEEENSVSIEAAFAKYDIDKSGSIDRSELAVLLDDLGVEPTEERMAEALLVMDFNQDGAISFEEFADWWHTRDVFYTLKRSEALSPLQKRSNLISASSGSIKQSQAQEGTEPAPVVSEIEKRRVPVPLPVYRGKQKFCDVAGLMPNRMYHFALRQTGPRSHSLLSLPLVMMTTPLAPSAPVVVRLSATNLVLKWYAPEYGVFKFLVQLQSKGSPWKTVYNGHETIFTSTTMTPDTDYSVRVIGLNQQGREGEPSATTNLKMLPRSATHGLSIKNAGNFFAHMFRDSFD